ncbi:MAG: hypothetical protein IPM54_37220 [Polyangiaceae bacterium]|nr:hypothetical protein [Polyangiaceae bacterium]
MSMLLRTAIATVALAGMTVLPAAPADSAEQVQYDHHRRQGGGGTGQHYRQDYITNRMTISERIMMPLEDGCLYSVDISGWVEPVDTGSPMQQVDPNIFMSASLSCPTGTTVRLTDNLMRTGLITVDALEQALERRGTIAMGVCVYRPNFDLVNNRLIGRGITQLCPPRPRMPQSGGGR